MEFCSQADPNAHTTQTDRQTNCNENISYITPPRFRGSVTTPFSDRFLLLEDLALSKIRPITELDYVFFFSTEQCAHRGQLRRRKRR